MPDGVQASSFYTATEIAERALRKIGAFAINDEEPDEADLQEALFWLDMEIAHQAGTNKCFWLMRDELEVELVATDADYDLDSELAQQLETGVQFPKEAFLDRGNGTRVPLKIMSQREFRRRIAVPATTGEPKWVFIDRLNQGPTMHVYPIPTSVEEDAEMKIILVVQTFSPSVKPRGTTGDSGIGVQLTGFPAAWNLWAVTALSALIGDGPVRRRPVQETERWKIDAQRLKLALDAYQNKDHDNAPPISRGSCYT